MFGRDREGKEREERKPGIAPSGWEGGEEKGMRQGKMSYKNEDEWEGRRDEQMKTGENEGLKKRRGIRERGRWWIVVGDG